jgi:hypothetical protein
MLTSILAFSIKSKKSFNCIFWFLHFFPKADVQAIREKFTCYLVLNLFNERQAPVVQQFLEKNVSFTFFWNQILYSVHNQFNFLNLLKPKTYSKKNDLHLFTAGTTSSMAIHTT